MGTVRTSAHLGSGTSTLDLALRLLEHLAQESKPTSLTGLAAAFSASKATVHRHLKTLARHGFARQDAETGRYDVGVKLLRLAEAARDRFAAAARGELTRLRNETRQAVTLCSLVENELVVLDLIQGQTVVEFGIRPGTRMDLHASAHGKVWLAFGPADLLERVLASPRKAWTPHTLLDPDAIRADVAAVRARGWATAPSEIVLAVNALAAPMFDHRGGLAGSLAIVGSTQFILPEPAADLLRVVTATAERVSRALGWRG